MRFALLGDHADGLDMARALAESGRHELSIYSGSPFGWECLRRWNLSPARVGDLEEVLADPAIDAIIVAGSAADRPAQLRRALQSERHALCVHPLDHNPDSAYEAAMLQTDSGRVLVPLIGDVLHPGLIKLAELIRTSNPSGAAPEDNRTVLPPTSLRLVEMELRATDQVLLETETAGHQPSFPGWNVLRLLGGEIAEVMALAASEEALPDEILVLSGRFERGGLFQVTLVPRQAEQRWRVGVLTQSGRAELVFPQGWPGAAQLSWCDETGTTHTDTWDTWNPWPGLVERFEALTCLAPDTDKFQDLHGQAAITTAASGGVYPRRAGLDTGPSWHDEIRCLELDDAARRSVARRRTSTLEYQEATEEASFKGTMTLVGCSLIWASLILLILSIWIPWLGWFIAPVFAVFLLLQLLRWVVPPAADKPEGRDMNRQANKETAGHR
jgi:hypothetical protein